MPKRQQLKITVTHGLALPVLLLCVVTQAAEVRGVVSVEQAGMFNDRGEAVRNACR